MPHSALIHALSTPTGGGLDGPLTCAIATTLLRNRPASVAGLAHRLRTTPQDVRDRLALMPETEYDADGRIVGYVLTQHETPHRFRVCDTQLFTWCPLDTVILPSLLGVTAHVEGTCAATGEKITFVSAPEGPYATSHADIAISIPRLDDVTHLRTAFCRHVRFFARHDAAATWAAAHPDATGLPLGQAHRLGAALAAQLTLDRGAFDTVA